MSGRTATRKRETKETAVEITLDLDGAGVAEVETGLPFFDHMVSQLGKTLADALGDKAGIRRFASIALPLDEALVEVALDLSGRPFLHYEVELPVDGVPLGTPPFDPQLGEHFWQSFATSAAMTLHVRSRSGRNTHHLLEASFKAVARCLRDAVRVEGTGVPSTKGTL
jgi:imidazoleglycerol-phosphate dehydratase